MTNELEAVWFLGGEDAEALRPDATVGYLALTDPGDQPRVPSQGWGAFETVSFADGDYDEEVIRLMGAEEFERSFQDYFDGARARQIRSFIEGVASRADVEELYIQSPHGRSRAPAVALWAARTFAAALRPDLTDIPNELVLALLVDPEKFEARLRVAKRRARENFVHPEAPEATLMGWAQTRAEEWIVGR